MLSMSSCNDYLDVEAPSKFTDDYVFGSIEEANRLLNSVYQSTCSGNTYGNAYLTTFCMNSDVEFTTSSAEIQNVNHNEWKLFDGEADGGNIENTWTSAYQTIERANNFINAAEASSLYKEGKNEELNQMIGEAKCLRAMNYLDLVILWGDIPFTFTRTYDQGSLVMPMGQRDEILTTLIKDLQEIAPKMKTASQLTEGVERCSKDFAWALISRIALYRAGYSLRHADGDATNFAAGRADDYAEYYQIAKDYAKKVMDETTHSLDDDYFQVFVDECNYKVNSDDDPIFEIPFVQNVNGSIGYIQGIRCDLSSGGDTDHAWGRVSGSVRLNAFYRFTFDKSDIRRNNAGFWTWSYNGTPTLFSDYGNYCMKWSKMWDEAATLGNTSEGNTGINFPYMRYADVLLMFAEAENEINGPTDAAKAALKQVRERAFRGAADKSAKVDDYVEGLTTKEAFFEAIVNERAWEFGGENLRWKDLVRWNRYGNVIYKTFFQYYGKGAQDYTYDFDENFDKLPSDIFFKVRDRAYVEEHAEDFTMDKRPEIAFLPNKSSQLKVLEFYQCDMERDNPVTGVHEHAVVNNLWENFGLNGWAMPSTTGSDAWTHDYLFNWLDDNTGTAKAACRCSVRGYLYADQGGTITGPASSYELYTNEEIKNAKLPMPRYILPIPRSVVDRSLGQYKNYYGY